MSVYLNLSFVWCQQSCGIFYKPECYMINVLKINCGLNPKAITLFTMTSVHASLVVDAARHMILLAQLIEIEMQPIHR